MSCQPDIEGELKKNLKFSCMWQIHAIKQTSYWVSCKNYQRLAFPPTDAFLTMNGCGGYLQSTGNGLVFPIVVLNTTAIS